MKHFKNILKTALIILTIISCADDRDLGFVDTIPVPTNVGVLFNVTNDNTGVVKLTPTAEGANSFIIDFGDGSSKVTVKPGVSVDHTYEEGFYQTTIVAKNIKGESTEATTPLEVSFNAPENLDVTIENDLAVSRRVNMTINADFAIMYEFHSGEDGVTQPVATANIGESITYDYNEAGVYDIKIVVKGAAIETTEYLEQFEVTEILQPIVSAPTPIARDASDVISIYTSQYTNLSNVDAFPDWGQGSQGSSWAEFDLNGDKMLQYVNLSYQGIVLGEEIDASNMEYIHLDVWTTDVTDLEVSLIRPGPDERPVTKPLTAEQWTSIDIPLSEFTDQGLSLADLFQLKFVGTPWAGGTVFIDNIYFWKESSGPGIFPLDFETGFELSSFDGGDISIVANPDTNGNNSATVAQMIKGSGQTWAGSKITVPSPFDLSEGTTVTAKVWSPRAGLNLLMKFEDDVPWPNVSATDEITATTTVAGGWETLSFTMTGVNPNLSFYNIVLIMDNGTQGDGSADYTIFVDDISIASFLDFEPKQTLSSFDGGDISIVANPDTNGNTSSMVAQMIKGSGQTWAGSKITVTEPFPISEGVTITAKVWSPRAGLNLLMKFEDAVPWPNVSATDEITATTTVAGGWETLSFTMTGVDPNLDYFNIVLIMDNGTQGDGSADYTIYVDDITHN